MPTFNDLTGKRFGRLRAQSADRGPDGRWAWACACDCGGRTVVNSRNLTRATNPTRSCGCIAREAAREACEARITHGHATGGRRSRTLNIWSGMMARCYDAKVEAFRHYGGRGILVDVRWHLFENFLADMGEAPVGLSLDRIDNSRGYSHQNCRWATATEQNRNTRRCLRAGHRGEVKALSQWCEELGLKYDTVHDRISRLGWTPALAFSTPTGAKS